MTAERKKRISRIAAVPLCALVAGGAYFGAQAISDALFSSAMETVGEMEVELRDGLWHYNALSAREQLLYRVLVKAADEREEQTARVAIVPTADEYQAAFVAVLYDYPLFCDLIPESCAVIAGDNAAYVTLSYLPDGEEHRRALSDFADAMTQDGISQALTDAEFALMLNDSLTRRCQYSAEPLSVRSTAYDALTGDTDGYGYALLYSLVCRRAGIDCAVVSGTVYAGDAAGAHAWNVLTLDGETGYTDVMWNDAAASIVMDGADESPLPFHGYYFLSYEEMSADHTPAEKTAFPKTGGTQNYYERQNCNIPDEASLLPTLTALLSDAQSRAVGCVEFRLEPALGMTDYALEEALTAAISAVNETAPADTPLLRQTNRIYHTSYDGGSITVQLFYEDNNE